MTSDACPGCAAIELPMVFLSLGHISTSECVFALSLGLEADRNGRGYLDFEEMATRLDRSADSCRKYLRHLHRVGIVETAELDGRGGAFFQMAMPPDSDHPKANPSQTLFGVQSVRKPDLSAGPEPAPCQLNAGTQVLCRLK